MILQASDITLQLGGNRILQGLDFALKPGELVGLIGPNGAGKTSLLRVLANLQQADTGELTLHGKSIRHYSIKQLAKLIGYLAQGAPSHWPLKVRRLVELGRLPYLNPWSTLSAEDTAVVDRAMLQAEVAHLSDRIVSTLSGGERLRVLIARMFATEPRIILADEPIAALDLYHQLHTMELLREHCDRGGSGVVVMHDLNMAARFCHRLVMIQKGHIVGNGLPVDVLNSDLLAEVYGIKADTVTEHSDVLVIPQQRLKTNYGE
jgi:ABC-type cobalamin/Fe3+-siderophores transport system ATPase subunit